MLELARRSRKLTQAQLATAIGVGQGTVSKYEMGVLPIPDGDLTKLSIVLDYPPHFFSLPVSIEGLSISESFHRKRQNITAPVLHQTYALAEIRRIEIQKLFKSVDDSNPSFPKFPLDEHDDDVEKIARTIRALWQIPPGPVSNLTKVIEKERGVIFEYDLGTRQIDGFSHRSDKMPPMFFLNKNVPPDRWRWTLAHELGHIIMHFHVDKLAGLKRYWKISMAALVMRAYHLKAITDNQRRNMFMRLSKAGYRLREPAVTDPPIEAPSLPYCLVQYHLNTLEYSDAELRHLLAIGDNDFATYYHKPFEFSAGIHPPHVTRLGSINPN